MKNTVDPNICHFLLTNSEEGLVDKLLPTWIKIKCMGESGGWGQFFIFISSGFRTLISNNLDFLSDLFVIIVLTSFQYEKVSTNLTTTVLIVLLGLFYIPTLINYSGDFVCAN